MRYSKNGQKSADTMCGIVGIFGRGADNNTSYLDLMLEAVRSRGETDETFFASSCCVGTRRLKIVDRENAIQPIFNEDRSKFIIFNGEIFNYKDIRKSLESRHAFRTNS